MLEITMGAEDAFHDGDKKDCLWVKCRSSFKLSSSTTLSCN